MTDVFTDIRFYNEARELENYEGYKDKVLLVFLVIHTVLMFVLQLYLIWHEYLRSLGDDSKDVLPIFISVDHQRDDYEK